MFSLLRAAFTLLICVLVVGFFLGWFSFSRSAPDPQTNKVNINLSVDKNKLGSDLQRFEQKVSKGIQDLNAPPPGNNPPGTNPAAGYPPASQANTMPRLSIGPLTVQPSGQSPTGPIPPLAQPQLQLQTPDYQFTLPLTSPQPSLPPGEGR
jgi:hypothetical protein